VYVGTCKICYVTPIFGRHGVIFQDRRSGAMGDIVITTHWGKHSTVFNDSVIKMAIASIPASKLMLSLLVVTALVAVRFAACKVSDCSCIGASLLCCGVL
jgi:hypothetical protein